MASGSLQSVLSDRNEIHKSCKTLESVVNVLNDYCEAANAILTLEKKLAKALREAAGVKCVAEIPANALNISAVMFETLSDVDSRFIKLADKECDNISSEVKKWFKKLAKEEKAHDERLANANAKIKQAGQLYEKKARKNPQDAAEEHTRYVNVLNGEWVRSCDGVRQFAPTVGQLGQWRAFCEGSWAGPVPKGPHNSDLQEVQIDSAQRAATPSMQDEPRELGLPTSYNTAREDAPSRASEQEVGVSSRAITPSGEQATPQYFPDPREQSLQGRPPEASPRELPDRKSHSTASLASLASFPAPPTHFPLPPVTLRESRHSEKATNEPSEEKRRVSSDVSFPRNTESPAPLVEDSGQREEAVTSRMASLDNAHTAAAPAGSTQTNEEVIDSRTVPMRTDKNDHSGVQSPLPVTVQPTERPSGAITGPPSTVSATSTAGGASDIGESEGHSNSDGAQGHRSDTVKTSTPPTVERSDTGKSNAGPSSPPRKEVPRLPTSVSHLANKYESTVPTQAPTSPRLTPTSPFHDRKRLSVDISRQTSQQPVAEPALPATRQAPAASPNDVMVDNIALRRRRLEELEDLELREQELELRIKEREIARRSKELEFERARLYNAQSPDSGYGSDSSPGSIMNRLAQRPYGDRSPPSPVVPRPRHPSHSYSSGNLQPPTMRPSSSQTSSQPSSPLYQPNDHAPYCGCETCSASKYRMRDSSPSARDARPLQPPLTLRPEKPKGWIRRLSMPVMGNAFSLDSKKNLSSAGIAGGPGIRSSLALADEDGPQHGYNWQAARHLRDQVVQKDEEALRQRETQTPHVEWKDAQTGWGSLREGSMQTDCTEGVREQDVQFGPVDYQVQTAREDDLHHLEAQIEQADHLCERDVQAQQEELPNGGDQSGNNWYQSGQPSQIEGDVLNSQDSGSVEQVEPVAQPVQYEQAQPGVDSGYGFPVHYTPVQRLPHDPSALVPLQEYQQPFQAPQSQPAAQIPAASSSNTPLVVQPSFPGPVTAADIVDPSAVEAEEVAEILLDLLLSYPQQVQGEQNVQMINDDLNNRQTGPGQTNHADMNASSREGTDPISTTHITSLCPQSWQGTTGPYGRRLRNGQV
ncbi:hypothetical protein IEO21_03944 [Rhodonia placenta]|uniref:Uncharacterized protein n=1 Tax=Rhodonia placenta TaxID=104341 RepID=A0A8H7P4W9_9APHY|nr:hypothetical protein IEO21_03944 [Postia placenta]